MKTNSKGRTEPNEIKTVAVKLKNEQLSDRHFAKN